MPINEDLIQRCLASATAANVHLINNYICVYRGYLSKFINEPDKALKLEQKMEKALVTGKWNKKI
jgi:hypothetical protein